MIDSEKQKYFKDSFLKIDSIPSLIDVLREVNSILMEGRKWNVLFSKKHEKYLNKLNNLVKKGSSLTSLISQLVNRGEVNNNILKIFSEKEILTLASNRKDRYKTFSIPKKSGGERTISAPHFELKTIQRCINVILQSIFEPNENSFGFLSSRSVADNARKHVGKPYVYNIDLKDFFPSISFHRVRKVLTLPPFSLVDTKENPVAFTVANLCCNEGVLPQGAPTSPILTNMVTKNLDRKLTLLAQNRNLKYTRYADDITFSGYYPFINESFKQKIGQIIKGEGFEINEKKVRLQSYKERQEVTGIVVNKKANVPKEYIKTIRFWLFLWEKYGLDKTILRFEQDYPNEKGYIRYKKKIPQFINVLAGKIAYWGMVCGKEDAKYLTIRNKFLALSGETDLKEIEELLNLWEKEGIEKVMEKTNF